ncbi:GNAT family N-acetyltransferase, partial [Citrobacter freundii]
LYLGAQAHLQSFYARFGFVPVTDIYDEDGIPHVGMAREAHQA